MYIVLHRKLKFSKYYPCPILIISLSIKAEKFLISFSNLKKKLLEEKNILLNSHSLNTDLNDLSTKLLLRF